MWSKLGGVACLATGITGVIIYYVIKRQKIDSEMSSLILNIKDGSLNCNSERYIYESSVASNPSTPSVSELSDNMDDELLIASDNDNIGNRNSIPKKRYYRRGE